MIKRLWLLRCDLCHYSHTIPMTTGQSEPAIPESWLSRDGQLICSSRRCRAKLAESPLPVPPAAEPEKDCRLVTVCDKCLQASCWQGLFMCDESDHAGTVDLPVYELIRLNREHPCYWRFDLEDTCPMCGGPPDHCTSDCERRRGKDGDL